MKVVWTAEAELDRLSIFQHILGENIEAALHMDELFSKAAAGLTSFPQMGRPGLIEGTRELIPHKSYRLVYEILDDQVWILALVHTARQWPPNI